MPNMKIDALGYITGGGCDKENHRRADRTRGAWDIWNYMLDNGYVKTSETGHHYRIIKPFKHGWHWLRVRFSGRDKTGAHEIGAHRFIQDLLPCLPEGYFSKMEMGKWIDCFCQGSSNVGVVDDPDGFMGKKMTMGGAFTDKNDDIYQARRERGDFGDVPSYQGTITRR